MGRLQAFDLGELIARYGLRAFVETGTGRGDGLRYAAAFPFERLLSVEIVAEQAQALRRMFADDPRVEIDAGSSAEFLNAVLPRLGPAPALFWLDAHFPGGDLGLNDYDAEPNLDLRLPLQEELRCIHRLRPPGVDVILIDDLRIYEGGPFGGGSLCGSDLHRLGIYEGTGFVEELFGATHGLTRFYAETGYLTLLPKVADAV